MKITVLLLNNLLQGETEEERAQKIKKDKNNRNTGKNDFVCGNTRENIFCVVTRDKIFIPIINVLIPIVNDFVCGNTR